ncbi:MAG: EamA family transporter [Anaerolineae bacterium]|nr:EamA family transporter [Anaerolineae bacterium]
MNWLIYALIAPLLGAATVFMDKYLVERETTPLALPVYAGIVSLVYGGVLWTIAGFPLLTPLDTALVIASGTLRIIGAVYYFIVLQKAEGSTVIVLFQAYSVFVLTLSFVFLGEVITPLQLAGFVVILAASIAANYQPDESKFDSKQLIGMLIIDLIFAASAVVFKLAITGNGVLELAGYEAIGISVGALLVWIVMPAMRREFLASLKTIRPRAVGIIIAKELIADLAKFLSFIAMSLGPVALVAVVGSSQAFYGILAGWLLTLIAPAIFREDISRANLLKKGGLAGLLIVGIWLVR